MNFGRAIHTKASWVAFAVVPNLLSFSQHHGHGQKAVLQDNQRLMIFFLFLMLLWRSAKQCINVSLLI